MRGFYVEPGVSDAPDAIVWIDARGLHRAILEPATSGPASPAPSGGTPKGSGGTPSKAP